MAAQQQVSPQQVNALARMLVQQQAVQRIQQIFNQQINPANGNVVNVIPRNVGLIKGFWVKVSGLVNNNDQALDLALTDFNIANLLSGISFQDLNNNTRIQTSGWHLAFVNSLRARRSYGAALINAALDNPIGYGANWAVNVAPATVAKTVQGAMVTMWYWIPLAYSDSDYRGAVYANVVNATMQLQLTVNPAPFAAAATDDTLAVYIGTVTATLNPVTITVYQVYMDQIPMGQTGPVLPMLDLSTIYELKNTVFTGLAPGQDFPMPYSNFRDFLSTVAVFYNGAARTVGAADINYWALQSANFTNLWKMEVALNALRTRNHLKCDLPIGAYYFGSREKPIATTQYGNMELILNPAIAGAGAYILAGYEDFALVNSLSMAGSLAAA